MPIDASNGSETTRSLVPFGMIIGTLAGCTFALLAINHPESAAGLLRPFGEIGFVLGNVHRGNSGISVIALFLTLGTGGGLIGSAAVAIVRRLWRHSNRRSLPREV